MFRHHSGYDVMFPSPNNTQEQATAPFLINQTCLASATGPGELSISYMWLSSNGMVVSSDGTLSLNLTDLGTTVYTCVAAITTENGDLNAMTNYTAVVIGKGCWTCQEVVGCQLMKSLTC